MTWLQRTHPDWGAIYRGQSAGNFIQPGYVPPGTDWLVSGRNSSLADNGGVNSYALVWDAFFQKTGVVVDSDVLVKVRKSSYGLYMKTTGALSLVKSPATPVLSYYDATFPGGDTGTLAPNLSGSASYIISRMSEGKFLHLISQQAADQYQIPDTSAVTGIVAVVEAKLISASGADISAKVGTILAQAGMDYRDDPTHVPAGDAFVSSLVPVQPYWQRFFGTTMRPVALDALTLPAELAQLTDTSYTAGIDPDYAP